jgi:hypothetical protein
VKGPCLVADGNRREQTRRKTDLGKASPGHCRNLHAGEANWGELHHHKSQVDNLNKKQSEWLSQAKRPSRTNLLENQSYLSIGPTKIDILLITRLCCSTSRKI